MHKIFLTLIAALGLSTAGSAAIKTTFIDLDQFSDFSISGSSEERAREAFEGELRRAHRLQSIVGEDRTLELTFTDIDMAGEIEPWRNRNFDDIRYVRSVYPPRMAFSYVLRDANGDEILSGEEKLSDPSFDFRINTIGQHRSFHYELEMLQDWARLTLPRAD